MAKLTLADGTVFEGTTEEIFAITERYGTKSDEPAKEITHEGVEYALVDRKAQVGDVVVFTGSNASYVSNDKPYLVGEDGFTDDMGDRINVYRKINGRTEANTLVYAPKVEPLKVGDYAVVIDRSKTKTFVLHQFDINEVVRVMALRMSGVLKCEKLSGNDYDFLNSKDLRKATDEEVAEAKAKLAQAEKDAVFTRLGRKPGEFREGDIVRFNRATGAHPRGVIAVLANDKATTYYVTEGDEYVCKPEWFELIAPVESRVDRQ